MVDQINIAQVFGEAEYTETPQISVAQVVSEAEYTTTPVIKVAQVVVEVETAAPDPTTPDYHPIVTILFTMETGAITVRRATSHYVSGDGTVYLPGLKFPEYTDQIKDVFLGMQNPETVTLEMEIGGGGLSTDLSWEDIVAAHEIRNAWVTLTRYDPELGELSKEDIDFRGQINHYELTKTHITLTVTVEDDPILDKLLPVHLVTTDRFHDSAVDLGRPINIPFGYCRDIPCWNVKNDTVNDEYDYIISYAYIEGLWEDSNGYAVKRNGVFVNPDEYTFIDGSYGTDYYGYAVLRFEVEQKDFNGNFMQITASVIGMKFGAPTARRIFPGIAAALIEWQNALNDPYGVDATDEAEAWDALPVTSWMCDFNIGGEQRKARDWFYEIFQYIPFTIFRAYDNQYSFRVETTGTYAHVFGDNDGYYDNCRIIRKWVTPASESYKNVTVRYDFVNDGSYYEISYQAGGFGSDRVIDLKNTTSLITAKKVLSYIVNQQIYSSKWVEIQTGPIGRTVVKGDIIRLYSAYEAGTYQDYIVHATHKNYSKSFVFECREYSDSIYADLTITDPTARVDSTSMVTGPGTMTGTYTYADDTEQTVELTVQEVAGYDFGSFLVGGTLEDEVLMAFPIVRPITLPAGLKDSSFSSFTGTAATATTVFDIKKGTSFSGASSVGSATFAASASTATFTFTNAVSFARGDFFFLIAPTVPDSTLANLSWTFIGIKDSTFG